MFRFLTAGESHGPSLIAIIEGLPAGLSLSKEEINAQLARRQRGAGRGSRQKIESDSARILSGVRGGETLGSPISLLIENRDWQNWKGYMDPVACNPGKEVIHPRPGHADLPGVMKYDRRDARDILERASARETAARVAAGACARKLLETLGVEIASCVMSLGGVTVPLEPDFPTLRTLDPDLPVSDPSCHQEMLDVLKEAKEAGDTLGGAVLVAAKGLVPGLGSYSQWDRRLDARLSAQFASIPSVKGVFFGSVFQDYLLPGSEVQDPIQYEEARGYFRNSNHAGGLEGGMTNGEELRATLLIKPLPTLMNPLPTVTLGTHEPATASVERSDTCAVVPAAVVAEAVLALGLAESYLEKFGGDSIREIRANLEAYRDRLREH